MAFLKRIFFSYYFITFLLILLGLSSAVATFIENDYDAQTAKVVVYNTHWFEAIMVLLSMSLMGMIVEKKMYIRLGSFFFHLAFVFILLGAGITRYFGYEGVIHIREGQSEHRVISEESYLQIKDGEKVYEHSLALSKMGNNDFKFVHKINGKDFIIKFKDYKYIKDTNVEDLLVNVKYGDIQKDILIKGGHGSIEPPSYFEGFELSWGSKIIELPFKLKLDRFEITRYPGSSSPSSYASYIRVLDEEPFDVKIFMNHPLTYKKFKFFQSSYDRDEKGTLLSVNNDPGKWPTYFAYFLLSLGLILNFFTKGSRFERLRFFLKENKLSLLLPLLLISNVYLKADDTTQYLEKFKINTKEHAQNFAQIYVQDYNGRIKPMGTQSLDILHKMSSKSSMYGLDASQIMLGILASPLKWEKVKLIKIKNKEIKKILKIDEKEKYISFSQVFDKNGVYKLDRQINEANEKRPSKRGTFEKDLIKLDERLNVFYLATMGMFYKIIPNPYDKQHKWYEPQKAISAPWLDASIQNAIYTYMEALHKGIATNDWNSANKALETLKNNQRQIASDILPSQSKTKAEVLLNKMQIFVNLMGFYFVLGLVILVFALANIFFNKDYPSLKKVFFGLLLIGFLFHTFGLALRAYISGHPPWSDTYESLVYVGWSSIFAGLLVFRKSLLSLAAASILGAIVMLVAHMNFISPQITPLVPVLKSYWLSIHVSVITGSYGFLALGAILGFISLILMIFKDSKNEERINKQIRQLTAINEISLIAGLAMLTIGNFIGGVWANESWGRYWGWDPKETWAFISIVVYTIVLHLRFIPRLNTIYIYNIASVLGFFSILMTYFGVNFYLSGMHSYASGDKVPVPDFVYYTVALVFAVCIFAFRGKDIKIIR